MGEDAREALATLKAILDAQESALKRQAKELDRLLERDSELSEQVTTLTQRAEEALAHVQALEAEAAESFQSREIKRLQMSESELSGHILKLNRRAEETTERVRTLEAEAERHGRQRSSKRQW